MPRGDKRSYKLEQIDICLNVHNLLLPPDIKGVISHKNHSMITTLIIDSINH